MERQNIKCPLLGGVEITDADCYDTCLVAEEMIKKEAISSKFTEKENFREICLNCKYHNMD